MEWKTLTPDLARALAQQSRRDDIQELRLRAGSPVQAVYPWGEAILALDGRPIPVTDRLLKELLDRATGFSPYALRMEESGLYLPLEHGCRMGLCGEAVVQQGRLTGLRKVSFMAIRMAREHRGVAERASDRLTVKGYVESVLIVSPPGRGKTTFLRDLIRAVSERGYRISVADERRELAAAVDGVPKMDVGPRTDVLSGCPKAQAMELLLRVMNPQVLAVDELSGMEEIQAAQEAAGCGVALFATAHGAGWQDLMRRKSYRTLLESGAISWLITLGAFGTYEMERVDTYVEDRGRVSGGAGFGHVGLGHAARPAPAGPAAAAASAGTGIDAGGDGTVAAHCGRAV